MQKKLEHETVAGLMRKKEKKSHILKNSRGITLIALIVTIIVLIILASITISTLTGNNSIINMALTAREKAEISSEREQLEIATAQAMEKNKFGEVRKEMLQKVLNNNLGENETEVTEDEESTDLYVKFVPSKRYYIVTRDGKLTYIGDEEKLSKTAEITADPASDPTPKLAHTVTLTVKTGIAMNEENLRLKYAWSKSATQEPEEFTTVELTGTGRTKKASVTTVDAEEGDYYLWVKAFLGENMETEVNLKKPFGPYRIKDHSTLRYCGKENYANSSFFNNNKITRDKVKNVTFVNSIADHSTSDSNCWDVSQEQKGKILAWYETDENGYYSVTIGQNGGVTANMDSSYVLAFIGYSVSDSTEVKIEGLENLDTSNVRNMSSMFQYCSGLTSLDVSKFNTSKVTDMSYMFYSRYGENKLINLDMSNFDTSNVTNMSAMFYGCSKLTNLDLSNFNTSKVNDMSSMFASWSGASKLTNLEISNFDTSNVTNMSNMFYNCNGLTSLDVSKFDTSSTTNMCKMFYDCSRLTSLNVSKFDTSKVTDMGAMFSDCRGLTSLDVSKFDTRNVTNMSGMFDSCTGLTSLDVKNFDTSNVTSMGSMFSNCSKLTSLDISKFDTSNVTSMSYMFHWCYKLTSLDVSKFDTSNVTSMYYMFSSCRVLTSLDVSKFDTSKVANMSGMFDSCSGLTSLDVSNFNTSNVTDISHIFDECSKLTSLDVSKFDTSKVTNMSGMFDSCSGLTSLDLSKFDTSNVTSMNEMFDGCSGLTILDLSNFDTSNVTNMIAMFKECRALTSLNVSNFDTSNVKYMGTASASTNWYNNFDGMFCGCSSLTELDLSTWDTSNVISMRGLFYNCSKLNTLKLNKFTTSQITEPVYYQAMFESVPTTVQITTNSTMKTWLETNFANWAKNITTI